MFYFWWKYIYCYHLAFSIITFLSTPPPSPNCNPIIIVQTPFPWYIFKFYVHNTYRYITKYIDPRLPSTAQYLITVISRGSPVLLCTDDPRIFDWALSLRTHPVKSLLFLTGPKSRFDAPTHIDSAYDTLWDIAFIFIFIFKNLQKDFKPHSFNSHIKSFRTMYDT